MKGSGLRERSGRRWRSRNRSSLAILLRTGRRGEGALALAEKLLQDAGGIGRLATFSVAQLVKIGRFGPVQAVTLAAALELASRVSIEKTARQKFSNPEVVE